jgi:deoxyhypusine monooxygenase
MERPRASNACNKNGEIVLKAIAQDEMKRVLPDYSKDFETLEKMEWAFSKGNVDFFRSVLDGRPSLLLRIHAVCMLADMKDERAVSALCETLKEDPSPLVRHEAAFSLGQLEFKSAVPALMEAMANDESVLVRHESAVALGSIGDETARTSLIDRLRDPNEDVRLSAEVALADLDFLKLLRARTGRE